MKNQTHTKQNLIKKFQLLMFITLLILNTGYSQVKQEWAATYKTDINYVGAVSYDYPFDSPVKIITDKDGNIIVTGITNNLITNFDIVTLKYNTKGELIWSKIYQSPDDFYDSPTSVDVDGEGNIFVTGYRGCFPVFCSGISDFITIKYNPDGIQEWVKIYNSTDGDDIAMSVKTDSAGNVFVAGYCKNGPSGDNDFKIIKYDTFGKLIWQRDYDGPGHSSEFVTDMILDKSGNVIVTGESISSGAYDVATLKFDSEGTLLWSDRLTSPGKIVFPQSIKSDNFGNIFIAMEKSNLSTYDSVSLGVIKYSPDGKELFNINYPRSNWGFPYMSIDSKGNFYITYADYSSNLNAGIGIFTIKFNNEGKDIWKKEFNRAVFSNDYPSDIQNDGMGNVYITGYSYPEGNYEFNDFTTIKYDENGNEIWQEYYDGEFKKSDVAYSMDLDSKGNVIVTGGSVVDDNYKTVISTVKYSQTELTNLENSDTKLVTQYDLLQNCPNPFNPSTSIKFELAKESFVKLKVYDLTGREVAILVNEVKQAGIHSVTFNGSNLSSGVYFYKIEVRNGQAGNFTEIKKMTLIK
jgi:uncharacterized delta-60 repeat protein